MIQTLKEGHEVNLADKHIVITGGTSGIGLSLVQALYPRNWISVIARPSPRLDAFHEQYDHAATYEAELSELAEVEAAADLILKDADKIDVLINNAAVQYIPQYLDEDFSYEQIRREITVNFTSICSLIYLLMPALLKDTPSVIMNVNSGLGLVPKTNSAIYCGTKGGLNIFSQSLRHQLEDTNIQVMQAFLPLVDTQMTAGRGSGKLAPEKVAAEITAGIEQGRLDHDIGKVKILRKLNRLAPSIAARIMKSG